MWLKNKANERKADSFINKLLSKLYDTSAFFIFVRLLFMELFIWISSTYVLCSCGIIHLTSLSHQWLCCLLAIWGHALIDLFKFLLRDSGIFARGALYCWWYWENHRRKSFIYICKFSDFIGCAKSCKAL